jgi:hypothetical protein
MLRGAPACQLGQNEPVSFYRRNENGLLVPGNPQNPTRGPVTVLSLEHRCAERLLMNRRLCHLANERP